MGDGHVAPDGTRRWTEAAGAEDAGVAAEVLELLMAVMTRLRNHLVEEAARHDLNPMQFFALRSLTAPTPMGQLADQLHCDRSHVTGVADELERRGALERQPHPDDRRVKLLVLTDVGEALREAHAKLLDGGPPAAVQEAAAGERQAVKALVEAARALLAEAGRSTGDATLDRVRDTLHAAAADERVRKLVRAGRVVEDEEATGFAFAGLSPGRGPSRTPARDKRAEAAREREQARRRKAEERAADARRAFDEAEREVADTRKALARAEKEAERRRAALERAEGALDRQ